MKDEWEHKGVKFQKTQNHEVETKVDNHMSKTCNLKAREKGKLNTMKAAREMSGQQMLYLL